MPIVLTEGDWPLIIDQPEDALDNTMVFAPAGEFIYGMTPDEKHAAADRAGMLVGERHGIPDSATV